ncbi:hypothetical protein F5890DRAFT_1479376, partial [Lentinula detonsa]
ISLSGHLMMFQREHQAKVNQLAERIAMPCKGISDSWLEMNANCLHTLTDYLRSHKDSLEVEHVGETATHGLMTEVVSSLKPSNLCALTFVRSRQSALNAMFKALNLRSPGIEHLPVLSSATCTIPYVPTEEGTAKEKGNQVPGLILISPPDPAVEVEIKTSALNETVASAARAGFWQDEEALAHHFFAYKNERMGRVMNSIDVFHSKWQKFEQRVSRAGVFLEERCLFLKHDYGYLNETVDETIQALERRWADLEQHLNTYQDEFREKSIDSFPGVSTSWHLDKLWLVALKSLGYPGGFDSRRGAFPQAEINLHDTISYLQSPEHRPLVEVLGEIDKMGNRSASSESKCVPTVSALTLEAELLRATESITGEVTGLSDHLGALEEDSPLTVGNEPSLNWSNLRLEETDGPKAIGRLKSFSAKRAFMLLLFCLFIGGVLIHLNHYINRRYQEIAHTYLDSESRKMLQARHPMPPITLSLVGLRR